MKNLIIFNSQNNNVGNKASGDNNFNLTSVFGDITDSSIDNFKVHNDQIFVLGNDYSGNSSLGLNLNLGDINNFSGQMNFENYLDRSIAGNHGGDIELNISSTVGEINTVADGTEINFSNVGTLNVVGDFSGGMAFDNYLVTNSVNNVDGNSSLNLIFDFDMVFQGVETNVGLVVNNSHTVQGDVSNSNIRNDLNLSIAAASEVISNATSGVVDGGEINVSLDTNQRLDIIGNVNESDIQIKSDTDISLVASVEVNNVLVDANETLLINGPQINLTTSQNREVNVINDVQDSIVVVDGVIDNYVELRTEYEVDLSNSMSSLSVYMPQGTLSDSQQNVQIVGGDLVLATLESNVSTNYDIIRALAGTINNHSGGGFYGVGSDDFHFLSTIDVIQEEQGNFNVYTNSALTDAQLINDFNVDHNPQIQNVMDTGFVP